MKKVSHHGGVVTNMSYDGNSRLITTVAKRRLEISQKAFLDFRRLFTVIISRWSAKH